MKSILGINLPQVIYDESGCFEHVIHGKRSPRGDKQKVEFSTFRTKVSSIHIDMQDKKGTIIRETSQLETDVNDIMNSAPA